MGSPLLNRKLHGFIDYNKTLETLQWIQWGFKKWYLLWESVCINYVVFGGCEFVRNQCTLKCSCIKFHHLYTWQGILYLLSKIHIDLYSFHQQGIVWFCGSLITNANQVQQRRRSYSSSSYLSDILEDCCTICCLVGNLIVLVYLLSCLSFVFGW